MCHNDNNEYSIGYDLFQKNGRSPFFLSSSYVNVGLIELAHITTLEASGRVTITDLSAKPLNHTNPNKEVIHQALHLMRKYYEVKNSVPDGSS